jgi:hypothetical protein
MTSRLTFNYRPLKTGENGELTQGEFDYYMNVSAYPAIIDALLLTPLQEKLKKSEREELKFEDIKITKTDASSSATRWESVYSKLENFLSIRADDSRAKDMKELQKFDGIGYCIAVNDLLVAIDKFVDDATSDSKYVKLNWPRMKKDEEYPREISIPTGKILIGELDILRPALLARKFCTGINNEVLKPYEEANKIWFAQQSGYSAEHPPKADDSPVNIPRELGKGSYIIVGMERVQESDYKAVFSVLIPDLKIIALGSQDSEFWRDYRRTDSKGAAFVNIKRVQDKLVALYDEKMKDPKGRYIIVPKVSSD